MPEPKVIRSRSKNNTLGLFDIDNDVKDYISAIKANGGSINRKTIYAVNNFVRGLKSDGIWDLLLDVGLFIGVDNLNAALVKLKTIPGVFRVLTNNNFVEGDYTKEGANAGLLSNGSTKTLNTNLIDSKLLINNTHFSVYEKTNTVGGTFQTLHGNSAIAFRRGNNVNNQGDFRGGIFCSILNGGGAGSVINTGGIYIMNKPAPITTNHYINKNAGSTNSNSDIAPSDTNIIIFGAAGTNQLVKFYSLGNSFSSNQINLFSDHVNYLMAQFGANAY